MRKLLPIIILAILCFVYGHYSFACTRAICNGTTCEEETFDPGLEEGCVTQVQDCLERRAACFAEKETADCDVVPVTNPICFQACESCPAVSVCQILCPVSTSCTCGKCDVCGPTTKNCSWKTCGSNTCSVNHSSTIPISDSCPEGCSIDDDCASGTKTCRWSDCSSGTCRSHVSTVSIDVDCPEDDCSACTSGSKCGCDSLGNKTCNSSGTGNSCVDTSSCPVCSIPPFGGKCGLDSENYLVCKLDGTGTGINCNSNSDCNCNFTIHLSGPTIAKPFQAVSYTATPTGGQGNITYRWSIDSAVVSGVTGTILNRAAGFPVGTYLISVRGTDSTGATATDSLTLDVSDGGSTCIIDSASAVPAYPKIIYLGGKFKVTWQTTDCSTCTITCNTIDKCGVNGLVQPVGGSGEIEIKPTASGYYAYKITCDGGAGGGTSSIVLPSTDVWDGISPTLKTNIGAYRVRRPFIFETPAFLKLLIDKLF